MDNQIQSSDISRISLTSDGSQANGFSGAVSISDDGQLIPFESGADNLLADDNNNATDAFIYNRDDASIELISIATDGSSANGSSSNVVISGNGAYVLFNSSATNLVDNDTNGLHDIFIRDRANETTELITAAANGSSANGISLFGDVNDTGDYVVFQSFASNLVANDTNGVADVFLRNRFSQTTKLVSVSSAGVAANAASELGSISDDGQYITFSSAADNLVADDTNNASDIFIRDRIERTTKLVSVSLDGAPANGDSSDGLVSGDGSYVVFESDASNLVADDTNGVRDIFVYDLVDQTTELVSLGHDGAIANGSSREASISDDGRYVAFLSDADNLIADDNNSRADIFVRDLVAETTIKVDADSFPLLSGDAQSLIFSSSLSDLVTEDTNETGDVFITELSLSDDPVVPPNPGVITIESLDIDSVHRFFDSKAGHHLYSLDENEITTLSQQSAIDVDTLNYESRQFEVLTSNLDSLTGTELPEDLDVIPVYEFLNSDTNAYLYTTDDNEIDFLETLDNYSGGDIAFYAFESEPTSTEIEIDTIPVFRMLNTATGAHFYSSNQNELGFIQDNLDNFNLENKGEAVFFAVDL